MMNNQNSDPRPELKFEDLRVGMVVYSPDFDSENGIEEITIKSLIMYRTYTDIKTGDEGCLEEVTDISKMDYFSIGLDGEWQTHKYEKFIDKRACQEYMLLELEKSILDNEGMIQRWQDRVSFHKKIKCNILKYMGI